MAESKKGRTHDVHWVGPDIGWVVDECHDYNGYATIRHADGTPNGDTDRMPVATVYDEKNARLIASAPALLAALEGMLDPLVPTQGIEWGIGIGATPYAAAMDAARRWPDIFPGGYPVSTGEVTPAP